jgi:serine/threonine protein kinase/predicted negative regulator of RcsB-dependent stress response
MAAEPTLADIEHTTGDDELDDELDGEQEPALAPGSAIGRYLVINTLGGGAMGVVLTAFDPQLDRKVALKLLRGDAQSHAARTRMQREAQALARLGHPNVVAVHDVGEFEDRVYLVMEFIEGVDGRQWQRERPRSWREVVRVYLQAGHGLAAAHNAGLIHRDFKPANVMIGKDGRVRVTDFGLARAAPEGVLAQPIEEPPAVVPEPPQPRSRRWPRKRRPDREDDKRVQDSQTGPTYDALSSEITRVGAMVGTPAYMAPEQFGGITADARSDQFSFCVAFYEALYGHRPFAGTSVAMLLTAMGDNQVRAAPRSARVPGWLRAALLRGLDKDPERRWPSMDALLEAIERTPVKRRRWQAIGVAIALTVGGATWGLLHSPDSTTSAEVCSGAEDKLAEVWSSTDRERVRIAFTSSGRPHAPATLDRVERELDAYSHAWAQMYVEACEATHVRWEQPQFVLDRRMRCLERGRHELGALVEAFAGAGQNPDIVERAVAATEELAPIEHCAKLDTIAGELPVPEEPTRRDRAEALRNRLAEARALERTGQVESAEELGGELLAQASELGFAPVTAEVNLLLGRLARQRGEFEAGRELLESAYFTALGEGYTRLATDAAVELTYLVGQELADTERGYDWLRHAQALVHARGDDPLARARLERYRVTLLVQEGRYEEALEAGRDALVVIEALAGPNSSDVATVHNNLGATLVELGRLNEAEQELRSAVEVMEQQLGPEHPKIAILLGNLGAVQMVTGHTPEAIATYLRAIDSLERSYGSEHPSLAALHVNLGLARQIEGDDKAALRELDEAQRLIEQQLGAAHPRLAAALRAKAEVLLGLGRGQLAEAPAREALLVLESNFDAGHPELARARLVLAQALLQQGRLDEAELELDAALAVLEAPEASESIYRGRAQKLRGELLLARGDANEARAQLERALATWERSDPSAERTRGLASTRLALARTLVELRRPELAAELARHALGEIESEAKDARLRRISRKLRALAGP